MNSEPSKFFPENLCAGSAPSSDFLCAICKKICANGARAHSRMNPAYPYFQLNPVWFRSLCILPAVLIRSLRMSEQRGTLDGFGFKKVRPIDD